LPDAYDCAVIGAGVFGAWIAYELRRAGQSVVLIDAHGAAHSRASSGGESRIIRMSYGPDEIYTRWSLWSLARWREFFTAADEPGLFHRTGVLWTAPEHDPRVASNRQSLENCGVRFEDLTQTELQRRFPQIQWDSPRAAIFEPDSGVLMARQAVQAVVREFLRLGGIYRQELVQAPASIAAGEIVFACGPWLPKLFPGLLGDLIRPTRQEVFFFGPEPGDPRFAPPLMPVWLEYSDPRGAYAIPDLENRGFKLAFDRHGPKFDPETGSRVVTAEAVESARAFLAERFPGLRNAPVVETRVCQYENTSNGDFLIDRHPHFPNVWLVGGGSGHGFKHGPAVGDHVAKLVTGEASVVPRFSLATKSSDFQRAVF
jgi:sarcosine oxidase